MPGVHEILQRAVFVVQEAMQAVVTALGGGNGDPAAGDTGILPDDGSGETDTAVPPATA
jgi:hypothetical protein